MAVFTPLSPQNAPSWSNIAHTEIVQAPAVDSDAIQTIDGEFASPSSQTLTRGYKVSKRIFDLVICFSALPALIILFMIIAAAIWIEDGENPFFFQIRTGFGGKRFRMFKFRTMVPNAESLKKDLMHLNELQWPDFKIKEDPRITFVGKFLRRTSLDELPQILNVFLGDMSLVGPRPTSFKPETYKVWHMERLQAVPGLTGLWQVSGRSNLEFDERVQLDIEYIHNQNMLYDIKLIFATLVTAIIKREGAY